MTEPEINKKYFGYFGDSKRIKPTAIVIHHTCTKSPHNTRSVLAKQGYSTHFEVDKDGTIYQYQDTDRMCCHCGSPNPHCIGIDVTHMKDMPFPDVQVEAVQKLVAWLCDKLGIPREVHPDLTGIYPHSALGSTVCPNGFPIEKLGEVK